METNGEIYDAIVVGGGPAGLSAAIYLARARFSVLVIERENFGGQITITDEVVNYPGILRTSGKALTATMRKQAENFGAEFLSAEVSEIDFSGEIKTAKTSRGNVQALGVVVAAGARPRSVGFKGEAEFRGHGVAYCATCDGEFFTGKELLVVGGGFAACEESIFLTRYATKVTMLVRRDAFSCAKSVIEAVLSNPKIEVRFNTELLEVRGNAMPESAVLRDNKTGTTTEFRATDGATFGVFVFAGYAPETGLLRGKIALDDAGYALPDEDGKTNIPGVYVAGDLRKKRLRQVVTAVADGAVAATALEKYLPETKARLGAETRLNRKEVGNDANGTAADSAGTSSSDAGGADAALQGSSAGASGEGTVASGEAFFDENARAQLGVVFSRMQNKIVLAAELDDRGVSAELKRFLEEIASLSDKIDLRFGAPVGAEPAAAENLPQVSVCDADGTSRGVKFHGVPGGHEINSFVLGLYNAAGPGQALDEDLRARIRSISRPTKINVLVSLSCTLCPEVVSAVQRIALGNENVTADTFDVAHFPQLRDRYGVMSVPALVVEGKPTSFGKKTLPQILDLIGA